MYYLERLWIWLTRLTCCRGFGIQSPSAYSFVRYVVNEHYPYYAYADLINSHPQLIKRSRKLGEFYFRLANYQQPHTFVDCHPKSSCNKIYVDAGCQKTLYNKVTKESTEEELLQLFSNVGEHSIVRVPLIENYRSLIDKALAHLSSSCVLIIENIKRNKETETYWSELVSDSRTGVSFDLYYCGIVFLNKEMVKQSYVVNF